MTRIAIVGTFDVENFGDLLFPILAEHELERRLGPIELIRYSYRELGGGSWIYPVHAVGRLAEEVRDLDLVVIGGGDLVRFDTDVAPAYTPTEPDIHHPTGYWLMPTLVAAAAGVPVAWNAVGVIAHPPEREAALLALATQVVDYLSVRDEQSRERLGLLRSPACVVPDTAFGLRALHGQMVALDERDALLEEAGVTTPYIVVQASPRFSPFADQLAGLVAAAARHGVTTIELPVSPVLGDTSDALQLADVAARLPRWPQPLALAEIVRGADAVVAQSLHLSIAALTAGVPVFRRPSGPESKYKILETVPGVRLWKDGEELGTLFDSQRGHTEVSEAVIEREELLATHWDSLAALVRRQRRPNGRAVLQLSTLAASAAVDLEELKTATERHRIVARGQLEIARAQAAALDLEVAEMKGSKSWRITGPLRWGDALARKVGRSWRVALSRHRAQTDRSVERPGRIVSRAGRLLEEQPLVSIIMPTWNTDPKLLARAISSVVRQTYGKWELCICDDGSTQSATLETLRQFAVGNSSIKVVFSDANRGISAASNEALKLATGEFVAFLDHDDEVEAEALYELVGLLNDKPETDVIYTDEDKIDTRGVRSEPFFKPDWSPEYFRGVMYVGHLLLIRRSLVEAVGGFDSAFDGVQDFELMLRVSERTDRIEHLPLLLYHWRKIPGSIAAAPDAKSGIGALQAKAVQAQLDRESVRAVAVEHPSLDHRTVLEPSPRERWPPVSIVIPTKDAPQHIGRCLDSIFTRTRYEPFEVVVVDNGTKDADALAILNRYPVKCIPFAERFNFSRANNLGVEAADGTHIVLLNNDTEIVDPNWLQTIVWHVELPGVGAVGPLLVYSDRTVQHAGVVLGLRGTADHVLRGELASVDGYAGSLACTREVSAVTGACLITPRSIYRALGGLNDYYATHYQDVDFCLRLRRNGYRVLFTPRTTLIHHESASRGAEYDYLDRALLLDCWHEAIEEGDPYYNPNFSLEKGFYRSDARTLAADVTVRR